MASPSVQEAKSDNRERLGVHPFPIRRPRSVYTVREILNFSRTYVIDDLVFRHVAESVQSHSAERLVVLAELKISFDEIGGPGIETGGQSVLAAGRRGFRRASIILPTPTEQQPPFLSFLGESRRKAHFNGKTPFGRQDFCSCCNPSHSPPCHR